jgi:hypothetical protein
LTAALLGSVVASTDAAAVFSMMRTTPLPRRVSALLRIESGANDPIAIMLTVGLLATATRWGNRLRDVGAVRAAVQLIGGAAIGVLSASPGCGCCAASSSASRGCIRCSQRRSVRCLRHALHWSARQASSPCTSPVCWSAGSFRGTDVILGVPRGDGQRQRRSGCSCCWAARVPVAAA